MYDGYRPDGNFGDASKLRWWHPVLFIVVIFILAHYKVFG
jgi:hypothetical protein